MREIKFRAWDGESIRYDVTGFEHGVANEMLGVFINGDHYKMDEELLNNVGMGAAIVMQYTGLKDKNGKEIYEGDILATENHENLDVLDEWTADDWGYGAVELDVVSGIRCTNNFWLTCDEEENSVFNIKHVKIIGNIYENPELLK